MTELRLIGEHDVDRMFDDSCIDKLLAIGKIELSCRKRANFINDLRTAVRHYIRDAGDQRSPLQEIKELESSASRMDFEEVAGALEALSAPARTHFAERTRRPGWTAIGATLPSADELRDPARQVAACEMVRRLCRQGGGYKLASDRWRPTISAPRTGKSNPKRGAEAWFITLLMIAYLSATQRHPPRTARHGQDSPYVEMLTECFRLVGASHVDVVGLINRMDVLRKSTSPRHQLASVLREVFAIKGCARWRVADIISASEAENGAALSLAIRGAVGTPRRTNPRSFGHWLAKHRYLTEGGLRLEPSKPRSGVAHWRVVRALP